MLSEKINNFRCDFLVKLMVLILMVVIGGVGVGVIGVVISVIVQVVFVLELVFGNIVMVSDWKLQFFNDCEWVFINVVVVCLILVDEFGFGVKEVGVLEFIDCQFNIFYVIGFIWYMQGFFNFDVLKEMGYQLLLVFKQIYNFGIVDVEVWCQDKYYKIFVELSSEQQDEVFGLWELGKVEFKQLLVLLFFIYLL